MKLRLLFSAGVLWAALCCSASGSMRPVWSDDLSSGRSHWKLFPGAQWRPGNILEVTVPENSSRNHHKVVKTIDLSKYRGQLLTFTVQAKAENVSQPPHRWNGIKYMLSYDSASIGKQWHHPIEQYGSFDWKELMFTATIPADVKEGQLWLGLEESSGKVSFRDLKAYAFDNTPSRLRCNYSGPVMQQPPLRGVMSPDKFRVGDLEVLSDWGANLIRWQFVRAWGKRGTDRELAEYDHWISDKLNELGTVLTAAEKNGLKVIVDLHSPPGGRRERAANSDLEMFYDRKYADYFVELWKRIATRFKGHPAIWAYDLVNEPMQSRPSEFGYWELQQEAAKAIRAIDPERPIIVESNNWCQPDAFNYLRPFPLKNIIYQVHVYNPGAYTHQMVHNNWGVAGGTELVSYPGMISGTMYNRERLRKILQPVRDFQLRYGARIYVGEFSAVRWAPGAAQYLKDCISIFEEYGWDWTYHAFREWSGWSVEHSDDPKITTPVETDTARKKVLLDGFKRNRKH